jgi:hypothetical protein
VLQSVAKTMRKVGRHLAVTVVVTACYTGVTVVDMLLTSRRYSIISRMRNTCLLVCFRNLHVVLKSVLDYLIR